MKHYRDLTGDDVLQAGDERRVYGVWISVVSDIGKRVNDHCKDQCFRRPLTPAEITAAERKRYEDLCRSCFGPRNTQTLERGKDGKYVYAEDQLNWWVWCKAVDCDPMGDAQ